MGSLGTLIYPSLSAAIGSIVDPRLVTKVIVTGCLKKNINKRMIRTKAPKLDHKTIFLLLEAFFFSFTRFSAALKI